MPQMNSVWINKTRNQTEGHRGYISHAGRRPDIPGSKCKNKNVMACQFKMALIDLNVVRNAADIGFVTVHHHSDSHIAYAKTWELECQVNERMNTTRDKMQSQGELWLRN